MDSLGRIWNEHEVAGWTAIWTRRGSSNTFDGQWVNPNGQRTHGVITISIVDTDVRVSRQDAPGYTCNYSGTLEADGTTVSGEYGCNQPGYEGPYRWGATIIH